MKHQLTALLFCLLLPSGLFAHHIIRGYVIDELNATPLIGATILIDSTNIGTTTNDAGYFEIGTDEIFVNLTITYMGYEPKTVIAYQHNTPITVVLKRGNIDLSQIQVGVDGINNLSKLSKVDLKTRPIKSSQDVLQIVPGLFIAQHAGGGKAEQIFLRGFDTDHGTDIAITADNIPVNMVSHAHGQGYADMHFIIPELINIADFGKGPYYSDRGNFNTAGYINLKSYNAIEHNTVKVEGGDFQSFRTLAIIDILGSDAEDRGHNAYIASDYTSTNGPFEAPQNFNRINLFAKYTGYFNKKSLLSIHLSKFQSKWDASGQIPDRAVNSGMIKRFGAIDSTEGGNTSRTNIGISVSSHLDDGVSAYNQIFFSQYNFDLFSNFTFFLHDSINGDQIRQKEFRNIYGFNGHLRKVAYHNDLRLTNTLGYGLRYDDVNDSELSSTVNRISLLQRKSLGNIDETNTWLYYDGKIELNNFLINIGLRGDLFKFDYYNKLDSSYQTRSATAYRLSPKANFAYNINQNYSLFLKTGMGFHSNDTRVSVMQNGTEILPAAYGTDLGINIKSSSKTLLNFTLWQLYLEQEFVYVGDEAIVEPSGKSQRMGVDFSIRHSFKHRLFLDFDLTYAYGRFTEEDEGSNLIPLAPELSSTGGIMYKSNFGLSAALRYRYIKDRAANEDNSIIALGYFVADARINYRYNHAEVFISAVNLFNTQWNEAQFATLSRLQHESTPVDELHYTPGIPLFIKGGIEINF